MCRSVKEDLHNYKSIKNALNTWNEKYLNCKDILKNTLTCTQRDGFISWKKS